MNGTWSHSPSIPTTVAKQSDFPAGATTKKMSCSKNGALVLSNQKLLRNLIASAMRHVRSTWRKTLLPSRQSLRTARVARAWRLHHRLANPPPKPNELQRWQREMNRPKTQNTITWHSTIKQQTNTRNKGPKKNKLQQWSSRWLDVVGNLFRLEYFLFGLRMIVRNRASCWRMVKSLHSYQTGMSELSLSLSPSPSQGVQLPNYFLDFLVFSCFWTHYPNVGFHGKSTHKLFKLNDKKVKRYIVFSSFFLQNRSFHGSFFCGTLEPTYLATWICLPSPCAHLILFSWGEA